jgi:metal-responsive CopG/Arc/MetJ family transcriptional regulator
MMEKHIRINISLPDSVNRSLEAVAAETNEKKSHIIAKALSLYFDELDTIVAEKRYNDYLAGKEKVYSLTQVEKRQDISYL